MTDEEYIDALCAFYPVSNRTKVIHNHKLTYGVILQRELIDAKTDWKNDCVTRINFSSNPFVVLQSLSSGLRVGYCRELDILCIADLEDA